MDLLRKNMEWMIMYLAPLFLMIGMLAVSFPETAAYFLLAWVVLLVLRRRRLRSRFVRFRRG